MVSSLNWAYTTVALLSCALSTFAGSISAPSTGLVVPAGDSFPFSYEDSNWCEDGYSQITVWLCDYDPTTANLDSTGEFSDGDYTYYFGAYLIPNFGLSVLAGTTPPPSSLIFPSSTGLVTGDTAYLTVVETGDNCPPGLNVPPQYQVTATAITVG